MGNHSAAIKKASTILLPIKIRTCFAWRRRKNIVAFKVDPIRST